MELRQYFITPKTPKDAKDYKTNVFGGVLGDWLFDQLGIQWGGLLGQLGTATVGAVAILWVASLIKK